MKTAHPQSEKGAIAPLLMVVMLLGLVFGVYLIQQKTNLFSKAYVSSPILPPPLISDDFRVVPSPLGWKTGTYDVWGHLEHPSGYTATYEYINNGYRITLPDHVFSHAEDQIDIEISDWTVMADFMVRGEGEYSNIGVIFSPKKVCDRNTFCISGVFFSTRDAGIQMNKTYTVRVDKQGSLIKAWRSSDQGLSWEEITHRSNPFVDAYLKGIDQELDVDKATWIGFYVGSGDGRSAEGYFDNFKVWRYGQLPEPNTNTVTTITPGSSSTPTPAVTIDPSQLMVRCDPYHNPSISNHSWATFSWPAANIPGKNIQNYTLRINKRQTPTDIWAPTVLDVRPGAPSADTTRKEDLAIQVGNRTSATFIISSGNYSGWDVTPGFVGETTEANQYKTFGQAFTCGPSSGGGGDGD